jgi:glycosyltransferase involved in cell wall biosynthesis
MTRLLWWLPEYPPDPGGIGTFAGHVAPAVAAAGHDVTMLVAYGAADDRQLAERLRIRREPFREALEAQDPRATMRLQRRTREIKTETDAELYHVHLCEPSPFLHVATLGTAPAPTVLTLHNEELKGFDPDNPDTLLHRLFSQSAVITCVSATTTRRFAEIAPKFAHRLVTIANGAPVPDSIAPYPTTSHIAAVGRLAHQKGFDRLLRALPAVIDAVPDVHLDLLGDGPEGPTLAAAIEQLGLGEHVTMHGHVSRTAVADHVRAARFLVAPSRFEGLPYAALEAAGNARAIVATRVAGTEDVVEHGTTGLLIDNDSADTESEVLASAIVELLRDPERAQAMGVAGRARTERLFSLDACVDSYLTTYRCALEPAHDVAVVVPVHNGERHLAAALDSALDDIARSGIDGQIVVVDDGSTDRSAEIARQYADRGVMVFTQPPLGAGIARNAGIALTTGTWIAHLDADDLWPAGRLQNLLDAAGADTEAVFGRAVEFADTDAPANVRIEQTPRAVRAGNAGIVRRSAYDRIGGLHPARTADLLEWSSRSFAADLRYEMIDDTVLERRIHATNMSHGRRFTTDTSRVALLKDHLDRRRAAADD